jgi:fucose 4-O-acetylase-like acetyltransferase
VGLVATLPSPHVQGLGGRAEGWLRYPLALFVDVPGVTQMPLLPLAGWFCLGVGAAFAFVASRAQAVGETSRFADLAGASPRFLAGLAVSALLVAIAAYAATAWVASRSATPLTRAHPAIVLNLIDLGARGLFVLALGAGLSAFLGERARQVISRLGQGTLVAYVVHVPFCYGHLGSKLIGRLDMASATWALVPLVALSFGSIWLRDRLRWTPKSAAR